MAIGRIVQNTGIYHGLSLFVKMLHNAEFTRIVHHHSRLYPLSLFVFPPLLLPKEESRIYSPEKRGYVCPGSNLLPEKSQYQIQRGLETGNTKQHLQAGGA